MPLPRRPLPLLLLLPLAAACAAEPAPVDWSDPALDLEMSAGDFDCILDWPKVRRFRVTNRRGLLAEALAVAEAGRGTYPPGTILQLVPDEAMVKRRRGWNVATNDWEFFALSTAGGRTVITSRGAAETRNGFGGNCFDCHARAAPEYDLVCETGHGCEPIPLGPELIESVQASDARCR